MTFKILLIGAFLLICSAILHAEDSDLLWIEAESSTRTNMSTEGQFRPLDESQANKFSGGAWLNGTQAKLPDAFAEYDITVQKKGTYKFFVRRFYSHGPFRWKIDNGAWNDVDVHPGNLQAQSIRKFVTATWIYPGDIELEAGSHILRVELLYRENLAKFSKAFGFDCFVLTPSFFVPNGKYSPLAPIGLVDEGMWAFETPTDSFAKSDIDLRYLNEDVAGQDGYVKAQGDDFILGNGEKVKFWCVNFHNHNLDYESTKYVAKQYAKAGVNMVRVFISVFQGKIETDDPYKLDEHMQDGYYKAVAAFKAEGIYVKICPYFCFTARLRQAWGIPDYGDFMNKWYQPFGVLFFSERLQEIYKVRVKNLMTTINPYTGITLAQDPAVAIVQTQNEDGLFFSTFSGLFPMKHLMNQVRKEFGSFLTHKYGSIDKAIASWDISKEYRDTIFPYKRSAKKGANGKVDKQDHSNWIYDEPEKGLMNISAGHTISTKTSPEESSVLHCFPPKERSKNAELIAELSRKAERRYRDSVEFMMEKQKAFNEDMQDFYKKELGCKALITSGNWKGSFCQAMQDRERYTYLNDDVADRHIYQSPLHKNIKKPNRASFSIAPGDVYADYTSIIRPWNMALNYKFMSGKPHILSECNWSNPNFYQLEGPWLVSVFGARNGLDMFTWFNVFTPGYDIEHKKFPVATPNILGQFPANALLYRKGYVEEVEPSVHEDRTYDEVCSRIEPVVGESRGFDPTRDKEITTGLSTAGFGKYPTAYLSGPITWSVTDTPQVDVSPELSALQNDAGTEAWGLKKQTYWNWGKGYATVDTKKAQGVVGFTGKNEEIQLSECSINMRHDFSSVLIVPLDDKPISESKKILVQVGLHARPYGWRDEPTQIKMGKAKKRKGEDRKSWIKRSKIPVTVPGKKILSMGEGVYNIPLINGTISFKNPILSGTGLNAGGYPKEGCTVVIKGNTVTLPKDSLYVILER